MKKKGITVLDGEMVLRIYHDPMESQHEDDVYIEFTEPCPLERRVLKSDSLRIGLTPKQAQEIMLALYDAAHTSQRFKGQRDTSPLVLKPRKNQTRKKTRTGPNKSSEATP